MKKLKILLFAVLFFYVFLSPITSDVISAGISITEDHVSAILLNSYDEALSIGEEFQLYTVFATGLKVTYKSSDSRIASVDTYGLVTAKKPGKVKITAKIKNAESTCFITVKKTDLKLNTTKASLECNETLRLTTKTSNQTTVKFQSNKSSVAEIDESGLITAKKPGEAIITVTADTTKVTCKITVKKPVLKLNKTQLRLYRLGKFQLTCSVSSKKTPTWKSNKKSVVTVDDHGNITAIKHGTAIISAYVDGVTVSCTVEVKQPTVTLSEKEIELKIGESKQLTAIVSSGNLPEYRCSNTSIVTVCDGRITAQSKGTAYVYAVEDGIKARCKVIVIDPKNKKK